MIYVIFATFVVGSGLYYVINFLPSCLSGKVQLFDF